MSGPLVSATFQILEVAPEFVVPVSFSSSFSFRFVSSSSSCSQWQVTGDFSRVLARYYLGPLVNLPPRALVLFGSCFIALVLFGSCFILL